ncbi:MAG: hypothetical protein AAF203_04955 [Pseudomonadota bacterium]
MIRKLNAFFRKPLVAKIWAILILCGFLYFQLIAPLIEKNWSPQQPEGRQIELMRGR